MTTSRDVFTARKSGKLDEAYRMALQRMGAPDKDEWDSKALGWCLIDLIKRDVKSGMRDHLEHYRRQLDSIEVSANDDVLTKQKQYALSLCDPNSQFINQAKQLSKEGRHGEAANLYRKLLANAPQDINLATSLGWEFYRLCKVWIDSAPINVAAIKRTLNDYLKLNIEKPSLLHSCILQVADKLAGTQNFNMVLFARMWGLEYLRAEDWERFVSNDHKEFPSLAEKVIQHSSKEAANSGDQGLLNYIIPYLDRAIEAYPDNLWLNLDKAKVLLALGRNHDALKFAIEVTKSKPNEYWTWELLGDITATSDDDSSLSCYCKALLCSSDDRFSAKVRLKLASLLVNQDHLSEAKYEINHVFVAKQRDGYKIPEQLTHFTSQPWYAETELPSSNALFYQQHITTAENILFSQLPWIDANLGEKFTIPGKEHKPKRKLYIKTDTEPMEVAIPDSKISVPNAIGGAIKIKGEWDHQQRFQIFTIEERTTDQIWDIFNEYVGVVDQVNHQKNLIHYIVDRKIGGVVPFSELESKLNIGDIVAVKVARYTNKHGNGYRAISVSKTDKKPSESLRRKFTEEVHLSNNLGFTPSDIFIPPQLIESNNIQDGDVVIGTALLSYNRKRSAWGWKAIDIELNKQQIEVGED